MGARISLVCERQAQHLRLSRSCERLLLVSDDFASQQPDRVVEAINNLARSEGVDFVLASDVAGLVLLSSIACRLECQTFPMAPANVLHQLNNKWHFQTICRDLNVEVPETLHFSAKAQIDAEQIGASIGYPVVVKPVGQWSSAGVKIVDSPQKLLSDVVRNADYSFQDLVVQEYIDGMDAGFGGLAFDGTLKSWTTFRLPAGGSVEFAALPRLLSAAEKIVKNLGFSGVINFDARVNAATGAVKLIECNPRFFVRVRASRLCGLDFVRAGLMPASAAADPPRSLTSGRYIPLGRLLSWGGLRQLASGDRPGFSLFDSIAETLTDPLPLIAEILRPAALSQKPEVLRSPATQMGAYS
jgi:biotin carboxylase